MSTFRQRMQSAQAKKSSKPEISRLRPNERILGVDPGKGTGIAILDANGEVDFWMNMTLEELSEFLNDNLATEISLIVIEEYIVGVRAQKLKGSKNEASQAIGIVRVWANNHEIPMVFQQPSAKVLGEKWSKISPNGQSHFKTHWVDALNHVVHYLVVNHYIQPESEVRPVKTAPALSDQFPVEDPQPLVSSFERDTAQDLLHSLDPHVPDEEEEPHGVLVQSPRDQPTAFDLERIPIRETQGPSSSYSVDGDSSQPKSPQDQD